VPALSIAVFPGAFFAGDDTLTVREGREVLSEENQAIEKMARLKAPVFGLPAQKQHSV
jgi:hypothetical protein